MTIVGPDQLGIRCTDVPCGAVNLSGVEQGARPDDAPARSHASPGGIVAAIGSALMIGSALVLAAMSLSSTWFTFRDSFRAE